MNEILHDNLGPAKVIRLYSAKEGLQAVVVIDNCALGPAAGGVRVSPTVTVEETLRLARTMTLKNSIAGLPHGGAKAGIVADPSRPDKERLFRVFARMIRDLKEYIPGPDMGCDETAMAWIHDEIGRSVGLPEELGGLPLDELGATGFGLAECAAVAAPHAGIELAGARVAIEGFGSVGRAAAHFLAARGARVVAVSDSRGAQYNPDGLDIGALVEVKRRTGRVAGADLGLTMGGEELFGVECDILVPAAMADVIHEGNVSSVKARLILEGANIPVTRRAEELLHQRGVLVIPDFVANAGGVIMAAMEYAGRSEAEAFAAIAGRIGKNTRLLLERMADGEGHPRDVADTLARERVEKAMVYRDY